MAHSNEHRRGAAAADIAFRHRALRVNAGIYARQQAPGLLPAIAGSTTLRPHYAVQVAWLGSEQPWQAQDARRLAQLVEEIARFGSIRADVAEVCRWHADRLRELVRQYSALARLEADHGRTRAWSSARRATAAGSQNIRQQYGSATSA